MTLEGPFQTKLFCDSMIAPPRSGTGEILVAFHHPPSSTSAGMEEWGQSLFVRNKIKSFEMSGAKAL